MSRSLILDPRTEFPANSPLELFTEAGKGPGVYVTDHKYPDPDQEVLSAGGREGKRRSTAPIVGNRQIPIELFVMGRRQDYPFKPANFATNPVGAIDTTGWSVAGAATAPARVEDLTLPIGAESAISTVFSANAAKLKHTLELNAGPVKVKALVRVRNAVNSAAYLTAFTPAGATFQVGQGSAANEWVWLTLSFTANAYGNWGIGLLSDGAGSCTAQITALLVEPEENATGIYLDGDMPGSEWSGAAHASISQQPAGGEEHFERMMVDVESAIAKIREEGGVLSRPYGSGRLKFDLTGLATGEAGNYEGRKWRQRGQKVSYVLEALPYGRGFQTTSTIRSSTGAPLVFNEPLIPGTVRAVGELEVTDTATVARRGIVAGVEVPGTDYDTTAATAALYYQAEALTPLGGATSAALTGAFVGTALKAPVTTQWGAYLSTKIAATSKHLTHVGTFRIWQRVYLPAAVAKGATYQFFLQWGQGDLIERVSNAPVTVAAPATAGFYLVDLGLVRVRKARVGVQRWEGQTIIKGSEAGNVYLDDLRIVPVTDAAIKVRAPRPVLSAPLAYVGRDGFSQAGGALVGKTADVGGVWAKGIGEGFEVSGGSVRSISSGQRIAVLPTVMTSTAVRVTTGTVNTYQGFRGVVARFVDEKNYLLFGQLAQPAYVGFYELLKTVGGITSFLGYVPAQLVYGLDLALYVNTSGLVAVYAVLPDQPLGTPLFEFSDPALATGGVLASGKAGMYENKTSLPEVGEYRYWDNFAAWAPPEPLLIAPGRRMRWRADGIQREDVAGGELWSPIGYTGDPLLIPPATKSKKTMRAIVFPTRSDLASIPDSGATDGFTAQLGITARHLQVR